MENTFQTNAFIDSGFICPSTDDLTAESLQNQINNTAISIQQSKLAMSTVEILLNTNSNSIVEVATWTSNKLPNYLNSCAQIQFSGHLEFIACSSKANSAIDGICNLWVSFMVLASCLTIAISLSLILSLIHI